jgi:hypothetical protein
MSATILPLAPGTYTSDPSAQGTFTAADLGKVYDSGLNRYRLVKAAALLTNPQNGVVATALSSGVPTWSVNSTTTAQDLGTAGLVPSLINGAATGTIPSGAYFLIIIAGPATAIASAAITAGQNLITSTTAFRTGPVATAGATVGLLEGAFARATAAQAAAGSTVPVNVYGLG